MLCLSIAPSSEVIFFMLIFWKLAYSSFLFSCIPHGKIQNCIVNYHNVVMPHSLGLKPCFYPRKTPHKKNPAAPTGCKASKRRMKMNDHHLNYAGSLGTCVNITISACSAGTSMAVFISRPNRLACVLSNKRVFSLSALRLE